jgi:membrane protease YdiL (CAAX protease family)
MNRRLAVFFGASFAVSWTAWGILLPLARGKTVQYGDPLFMGLYVLGGLGPTIAAYASVLATSGQGRVAEYNGHLLRWRLGGWWYLAAVGVPVALAVACVGIEAQLDPDMGRTLSIRPWYTFLGLLVLMIAGGGLEELGWRGVAQAELERGMGRSGAAVLIGLVWAAWHLPLFALPGVSQYGTYFPVFAVNILGMALILAWLYGRNGSILPCILFHASSNAVAALGFTVPSSRRPFALANALLTVSVGCVLLALRSRAVQQGDGADKA